MRQIQDRYANHEASERIEKEYKDEIKNLRGIDGDYHHGFNTGLLAATRMFLEQADILHINDLDELGEQLTAEAEKHKARIEATKKQFPNTEVNKDFPQQV